MAEDPMRKYGYLRNWEWWQPKPRGFGRGAAARRQEPGGWGKAQAKAAAAGYSSVEEWEAAGWPHPQDPDTGAPYEGYKIDRMERGRHPDGRKMEDEDWFNPRTQYIFDYLRGAQVYSTHYEWADQMRARYPNYPMPGINMDELLRQMFPDWYGEKEAPPPEAPRAAAPLLPTAETFEQMIPQAARDWMVRLGMEVPERVRRPPEDRALPIERRPEAEQEEQRRAIREAEIRKRAIGPDWAGRMERDERKATTWRDFLREKEPTPEKPPVAPRPLWEGMGDLIERAKEVLTRPEITEPLPKPEEVAVGVGKILVGLPILPALLAEAVLGRLKDALPIAGQLAGARPRTVEKIVATSLLPAEWTEYAIGRGMLETTMRRAAKTDERYVAWVQEDPKRIAEQELGELLLGVDDATREILLSSLARIAWSPPQHQIKAARRLIDPTEYECWARYEGELVEIKPGTTLKEGYAPVDMYDPDVVTQILRQEEHPITEFILRTLIDPLNLFYIPEVQQAPGAVWRRLTGAKTPAQRARQKLTAYYAAEGKEVPRYVEEFLKSAKGKPAWYQKAVANVVEDWISPLASRYKAWKARGAPAVIMSLPEKTGDFSSYIRAAAKAEDEIARSYALVYPRAGTSDPNFLEVVAKAMSGGLNPAQLREMRVLVIEAENYRALGNMEGAAEKIEALEKIAKEGLPLAQRGRLLLNLSRTKAGSMSLLRPTPAASREMMADDAIRALGWMFEDMPSGIDRAVAALLLKKDPGQLVKEFPWLNSHGGLQAFRIFQHIRDDVLGSYAFATGIASTNIQGGWTAFHQALRRVAGTYHYPSPRPDLWQRMIGQFYRAAPRTFLSTGRYPIQNISSNFTNIWGRYGWVTPRRDASSLEFVNRFMGDAGFLPPGFARSITAAGEVSTERIPTLLGRKWVYEGPTTRGREAPSEEALAAAREVARGPSPVAWAKRLTKRAAPYVPFGEGWIDLSKWGERNASMANYRDVVETIKGEFGQPRRGFLPGLPGGVEADAAMRAASDEILRSSWNWGEVIERHAKLYGVEVKPQAAHFVSTERIRNLGAEAIEVADDLMEALTMAGDSKATFQRRYRLIKKGIGKHVGEWIAAEPDFPEMVELPRAPLEGLTPEQAQRLMALTGTAERNRGHIRNARRILVELAERNTELPIKQRYDMADIVIDKAYRDYFVAGREGSRMRDHFWATINDGRLWPMWEEKINKMHATAHTNIDREIYNVAIRLGGDPGTLKEELDLFPWGGLPKDMADRKMRALQDDIISTAYEMQAFGFPLAPEGVVTPPLDSIRAIKDWAREQPLAANAWLEYMQEAIQDKALAEAVEVVARTPAEEIKRARRASWREGTARQIELMEQKIARLQEEIATSPVAAADVEQLTTRQQELYGMAMELEGHKDTLSSLPTQKEVFRFWDYKEGGFRKVKDPSGRVVDFAKSEIVQEIAYKHYGLEHGLQGAETFGEMIRQRLEMSNRIAELENLIWEEPELILPETAEGLEKFIAQSEPQLEQMMKYEREPQLFQTGLQHYEEAVDRLAKIRGGEAMPESVVSKVENAKAEIAKLEREREAIRLATLQRNRIPPSAEERVMLAQDLQTLNEQYVAKGVVIRNRLGQGNLFEDLEELRERGFFKRTVRGVRKADKARAIPKIGYQHYFYTLTDEGRQAVKGISIVRMPETVPKPVAPGSRAEAEIPDVVAQAIEILKGQVDPWPDEIIARMTPTEIVEAMKWGFSPYKPPFTWFDRYNTPEGMIEKAIAQFGLTEDWREAGYILPDGKLLDFSGKKEGMRLLDHRDIGFVMASGDWGGSIDQTQLVRYFSERTGSIQVGPLTGFPTMGEEGGYLIFWLQTNQEITTAQRAAIRAAVGKKPTKISFEVYDRDGWLLGTIESREYPLVSQVDGLIKQATALYKKGKEVGIPREAEPPLGVPGVEAGPPVTAAEQATLFGAPKDVGIPRPEVPKPQLPGFEAGELFGGGEIPMELPPEARERLPELPMEIEGLTPEAAEKAAMEEGAYRLPGVEELPRGETISFESLEAFNGWAKEQGLIVDTRDRLRLTAPTGIYKPPVEGQAPERIGSYWEKEAGRIEVDLYARPEAVAPEVAEPEEFMPEGYGERWQAQVESLIEVEERQVASRQFADGRQMTDEEHQRKVQALDGLKAALEESRAKPGLVEFGTETTEELVIEGIEKGEEVGEATREVKAAILKAIGEGRTVRAKKAEGGRNYWNGFLGFETSGVDSLLTPEQFAKIRSGEIQVNGWPEYMPDQEYAKTFEAYRISRAVATHRIESDPRQRLQYSKEVLADLRGKLESLGLEWEAGVEEGTFTVKGPEELMEEAERQFRLARVKYGLPEPIPGVVAPEVVVESLDDAMRAIAERTGHTDITEVAGEASQFVDDFGNKWLIAREGQIKNRARIDTVANGQYLRFWTQKFGGWQKQRDATIQQVIDYANQFPRIAPEVAEAAKGADQILGEINGTHARLQGLRGTGKEAELAAAQADLARLGEEFRAAGGMEAVTQAAPFKAGQEVIVTNAKLIPAHINLSEGDKVTVTGVRSEGDAIGYISVDKRYVDGFFDPKAFGPVTEMIEPRVAPKPELPKPAEILREKGVLPAYEEPAPPAVDMDELAEMKTRALEWLHAGREHGDMRALQNADQLYIEALEQEHSIPAHPDEPKKFEIPAELPKSRRREFENLVRAKYELSFLHPRLEALLELERTFSEAQGMTPVGRGADPVWEDLLAHVPEEYHEEIQPYAFLPDHLQPLSYIRTMLFDVDWRIETAEKKLADMIERLPKKWKKLGKKILPTLADLAKPPEEAPAGIPTMITNGQREALSELGYSEAMINQMTPDQALGLVQGRLKDFAPAADTPFGPMRDVGGVMPPSPREGAELKRDLLIERMDEWYKDALKEFGKEIESDPTNFGNVNRWLEDELRGHWGQMKIYMDKMGEATTAWTLYNYRKFNIDTLMYRAFWWPYWQTRTGHRWLTTFLENPAKLALWARWHDTHRKINDDLPEAYRDTVHIPDWVPVIGGQYWNPYFFFDPVYAWVWSLENFVPTWRREAESGGGGVLGYAKAWPKTMLTSAPISPLVGFREWLEPMITEEGRRVEPITPWTRALYERTGINVEAAPLKALETMYEQVKPSIYSAVERTGRRVGRPGMAERALGGPGVIPIIPEGRYEPYHISIRIIDMWLTGEIEEDEMNEAMEEREGPIWDLAYQRTRMGRGTTEFTSILTGVRPRELLPSHYEIEEFKRQRGILRTMEEGPEKREYREQFYDNFPWGRQYDVRYDSVESAKMEGTISDAWQDIENQAVISEKKLADAIRSRPGDLEYEHKIKTENRDREETRRAFWQRQGVSFLFNPRTRTYEEIEEWVSGQILGQFYYHLPQAERFKDEEGAIDWDAYNGAVKAFWEDLPQSVVKWEDIVRMDQEVSDSIGTKVNVLSLAQAVATEEAYDEWRRANDIPEEALNYVWKKYIIDVANEFYQEDLKDLEYDERNMPAFFAEFGHKTAEELIPYILKEYPGMWTDEELAERLTGMTMPGIWERWNQDGDERSTAISLLWAFWGGQTGLGRRRMKEVVNSTIYNNYFVDKESRNYERITNEELEGWLKELNVPNPWDDNDGALRTLYYWTVDSTGDPLLYKDEEPEARGRAPGRAKEIIGEEGREWPLPPTPMPDNLPQTVEQAEQTGRQWYDKQTQENRAGLESRADDYVRRGYLRAEEKDDFIWLHGVMRYLLDDLGMAEPEARIYANRLYPNVITAFTGIDVANEDREWLVQPGKYGFVRGLTKGQAEHAAQNTLSLTGEETKKIWQENAESYARYGYIGPGGVEGYMLHESLEIWLRDLMGIVSPDAHEITERIFYSGGVDIQGQPTPTPEARGRVPGVAAPMPFEPPPPEGEEEVPPQPLRTIPQLAGTSESEEYARAQDEMGAWVAAGKEGDWTPLMEKWFGKDTPAGFFWEYYWAEIPPGRIADDVRGDPIIEMLLNKAFRTVYDVKEGAYEAALETLQVWREAHPELPGDPKEWAIVRQIVKKYWELREAGAENEARAIWMYFGTLLEPYYPSRPAPKRKPMPAYMRRGGGGGGGGRKRGTFLTRWRRWANIRYYPPRGGR